MELRGAKQVTCSLRYVLQKRKYYKLSDAQINRDLNRDYISLSKQISTLCARKQLG